jgi:hypothetical protein
MATCPLDLDGTITRAEDEIVALLHKISSTMGQLKKIAGYDHDDYFGYDWLSPLEMYLEKAHGDLRVARKRLGDLKRTRRARKMALRGRVTMCEKIVKHKERVVKLSNDVRKAWYDSLSDVIIPGCDAPRAEALKILCDGWARLNSWIEYIDCSAKQFPMIRNIVRDNLGADIAEWRETAGLRVY